MRSWSSTLREQPILGRSLMRRFVWRMLVILAVITAVLTVLDLLNKSDDLLAPEGATSAALWRYTQLRMPQLVAQFAPFASLLSVLTLLSGLSASNEITAMRAGGLSAMRILAPFMAASAGLALAHFAFNELVATPASARLGVWERTDYEPNFSLTGQISDIAADAFAAEGGQILKVRTAQRLGERAELRDVTLYERDEGGRITRVVHAETGVAQRRTYQLSDIEILDLESGALSREASGSWRLPISVDRLFAARRDPDQSSLGELRRAIQSMRAEGSPAVQVETVFWSRLFRPVANLVMPLMGAVAGFGLARRGGAVARLLIGGALGFSFFVVENVMVAFGELRVVDPLFAGAAPFAIYFALGLAFALSID